MDRHTGSGDVTVALGSQGWFTGRPWGEGRGLAGAGVRGLGAESREGARLGS